MPNTHPNADTKACLLVAQLRRRYFCLRRLQPPCSSLCSVSALLCGLGRRVVQHPCWQVRLCCVPSNSCTVMQMRVSDVCCT